MIAVGAIFRDEAPYLREWIEFHRLMGVEKFYLLDNLSTDSFREVLAPYIQKGIVDLSSWPLEHGNVVEWNEIQCLAYDRILHKARGQAKWLALIDIDEFLFSPQFDHLDKVLSSFEEAGGVCVNWQAFGTSGISQIPSNQLLIESLNLKWPISTGTNHHVKSIIRPDRVESCIDPHYVEYKAGFFQVNTNKTRFEGKLSPTIEIDLLRLNHYTIRDEFYFKNQKIPRLKKWWNEGGIPAIENWEAKYKGAAVVEDHIIHRFVPKLRQSLFP